MARLAAELEQQLRSRLDHASQAVRDLERRVLATEDRVRSHQEDLVKVSERVIEAGLGRLQESIARLEHEGGESARAAVAKWLAEIDAKAAETTHTTFESLFKTADWYEKKVQTQMQTTLEKALEQASSSLREKAGEISGLFAAELDHSSRNYVGQGQIDAGHKKQAAEIEEAARETLKRAGKQAAEMGATTAAALARQMHSQTESALGELQSKSGAVLGELSTQMDARAAQIREGLHADGQQLSGEFRSELSRQTQQVLGDARRELASQVALANDTVRATGETLESQLRQTILTLSDDAMTEYKGRLENASNSWLLTTVAKLSQQSEQHIESVARLTEERLHQICNQVFTSLGETLRSRMLDFLGSPSTKNIAPESI